MKLKNQIIALQLILNKRYELDWETGDIISNRRGIKHRMIGRISRDGYKQYGLYYDNKNMIQIYGQGFSYLAKTLAMYDPSYVIDHIDRDRKNNKPANLRCVTHKENIMNAIRSKRTRKNKKRVVLTGEERKKIAELNTTGISQRELARRYGAVRQTIARICNNV